MRKAVRSQRQSVHSPGNYNSGATDSEDPSFGVLTAVTKLLEDY